MLGNLCGIGRRFAREERGVVLILFILVFIPLLMIVAVAMDFSQTLVVKRALTSAVDSAALSLAVLPATQSQSDLNDKAEAYIKAHYPENAIGTLTRFTAARNGDMVNVSATAEIPTAFLGITGKDRWTITVNSGVFRKQNKLEVVMVLDNSGSMLGSKMTGMKDAAKGLVDALFGNDEVSDQVKVGLVPFTGGVNIGVAFNASMMDYNNPSVIDSEVFDDLSGTDTAFTVWQSMLGGIGNWGGCVRSRSEPADTLDTAPSAGAPDTLFASQFKPARGKSKNAYKGKAKTTENEGCPAARVQALTNTKSTIVSAINAMVANGNTNIPEGLAWGWRVISPGQPFTEGVAYDKQDTIKSIILLTDGENSTEGSFSSYGPGDGTNKHIGPNVNAGLDAKMATICANIKRDQDGDGDGPDIVVYTIAFAVSGPILTRLQSCATTTGDAYTADSVSQLQSTFASIAAGLNQLRLAQ
jgi:Flp pilus assembly protein TadG